MPESHRPAARGDAAPADESRRDVAPADLPTEEFTRVAGLITRWVAEYLEHPERYPVLARVEPGAIARALPSQAPAAAEPFEAILADLDRVVMPGVTHWNHPGFLAYFANTGSVPGILGELVIAALNQVGILWRTSPALAELEQRTTGWLRDAMGLPPDWFGMITDTASVSTLIALAAARERDPALAIRQRGMAGRADLPRLRMYCSEHAHSSVDKAAITLGLGTENVVRVEADGGFRMRLDALDSAIAADRAAGFRPLAVVATVGTTSSASVDPVAGIAALCRRDDIWLHVDAAYAGVLGILPERRDVLAGCEHADSLVVNPHKWLFTPMDCSVLWTRHPQVLRRTFSLTPAYLETAEQEVALSYSEYSFHLGRRFRALKLWFVMRAFGLDGLAARLRHHCALAARFAAWVREDAAWEVVAPVAMSVVCFRYRAGGGTDEAGLDRRNAAILDRVNASGRVFLSHTKLGGRYVLRVAVGNLRTQEADLMAAWELLRSAAIDV
jgi:aromatic-L-amino-acid decarboxylase